MTLRAFLKIYKFNNLKMWVLKKTFFYYFNEWIREISYFFLEIRYMLLANKWKQKKRKVGM